MLDRERERDSPGCLETQMSWDEFTHPNVKNVRGLKDPEYGHWTDNAERT